MSFKSKHYPVLALALCATLTAFSAPSVWAQQAESTTPEKNEIEQLEEALKPYVMPRSGPFRPDQIAIGQAAAISAWAGSAHANASSESFSHWNDEGEIPPVCATCHAGAGFRTFYGLDGSAPGLAEHPVPTGGVVDCETCHNPGLLEVKEVRFPSGLMHPVEPGEASCLTCHQGRAAGTTVEKAVAEMADDTPNPELGFINPHYAVAAATWLGGYGGSGYHYPGKAYSGRFFHARPVASCASCHEPHTLKVVEQSCMTCHEEPAAKDIRLSRLSYDGSGDLTKGISADIAANAGVLKQMLADYATKVVGISMVYDGHRYPYFFADVNGDGRADMSGDNPTAYRAWTPRLLKATYNWKFVTADPGAYAHNPHYALELLYDSIEDLAGTLDRDMSTLGIQR
ncbi:cytochrome C [Oceaniovalibus sp. ACAM 378]|uniref:cytochrome C n=1 Tax=Oceaniovalibus sp. ACAM 378 TaxID=2599923 RepID=UPI0021063696|nr:cytochrome C [Oceaniovalibus sp. ACAM 378]